MVYDISTELVKEGEVFIILMEDGLVVLTEKILATKLKVGKDIGVISYNETPLKKIIPDGITTISTDFQLMVKNSPDDPGEFQRAFRGAFSNYITTIPLIYFPKNQAKKSVPK